MQLFKFVVSLSIETLTALLASVKQVFSAFAISFSEFLMAADSALASLEISAT